MSSAPMPGLPSSRAGQPGTAESPEPIPAAGVMLHLLGAVALGWTVIIWAVLASVGAITASVLGVAVASAALTGSLAWSVWLVRATRGRGEVEHEEHGHGSGDTGGPARPLDSLERGDPEEHFHSN